MSKKSNKEYLKKIQRTKRFAYPVLNFLDKTRLLPFLIPVINYSIRKAGIKKQFQKDLNYRLIGKAFKNVFEKDGNGERLLVMPFMGGGNNIFLLINFMIAHFLSKRNFKPVFFICDKAVPLCNNERIMKDRTIDTSICSNCYNPYAFLEKVTGAKIVRISDFLNLAESAEILLEINRIETLEECKQFVFDGYPLGEIGEKSVLRYFYLGALEEGNEDHIKIYKETILSEYYFLNSWLNFIQSLASKPELVLLYNGTLSFESLVRYYCSSNNINYVTNETYIGGKSWIYKKNDEVMLLRWAEQREAFKSKKLTDSESSKAIEFLEGIRVGKNMYAKLNEQHELDPRLSDGNFVTLFTNLIFDTAVLGRNPIFDSMYHWIAEVVEFWIKHDIKTKLVIRVHPGELKLVTISGDFMGPRIKKLIEGADNIILFDAADKVNSYDLIDNMKFGLIYSSTIGMEMAYYGKKCIVAGDAFYKDESFVSFPGTKERYFSALAAALNNELELNYTKQDVIAFVYFIYFERTKQLKGIEMDHVNHVNKFSFINADDLVNQNIELLREFEKEVIA